MELKQSYDYDCGHCCVQYFGFDRPKYHDKRGMSGEQILKSIGGEKFAAYLDSVNGFEMPGIYHLVNNRTKACHWVAYDGKNIYEPTRGKVYSDYDDFKRFFKSWSIEFAIVFKNAICNPYETIS